MDSIRSSRTWHLIAAVVGLLAAFSAQAVDLSEVPVRRGRTPAVSIVGLIPESVQSVPAVSPFSLNVAIHTIANSAGPIVAGVLTKPGDITAEIVTVIFDPATKKVVSRSSQGSGGVLSGIPAPQLRSSPISPRHSASQAGPVSSWVVGDIIFLSLMTMGLIILAMLAKSTIESRP